MHTTDQNEATGREDVWPWMLALTLLTLLFFLSFFNRFAGLRSGNGEFYCGMAFLHGHLPYRDYFSATPPLNTLKSALLLKLFGQFLIVSRTAGVVERVLIVLTLFRWLARLFPLRLAFLASLVTIVVSAGDRSDPVASYNHDVLFLAILSGYAASKVLATTEETDERGFVLWSVASGFFAGLCLLTKQTIGLGAVVVAPVAVCLLLSNRATLARGVRWLGGFAVGCAMPVLAFFVWLAHMKMLTVFASMVFRQGPAAKGGSAGDFFVRAAQVAYINRVWASVALVALVLGWRAMRRSETGRSPEVRGRVLRFAVPAAVVILTAIALAFTDLPALEDFGKTSIYFVLLALVPLLCVYVFALFRGRLTLRQGQFALFAVVSFNCGYLMSLSWPAFEAITLPGLGFLFAAVLDGTRGHSRRFVYLVAAAMVFLQVREKMALPFAFGNLSEPPVRKATARSNVPELKGLRFDPPTRDFLDQTTAIILANSTPAQTIFTYPEMGVFYSLTDRIYPTLSGSHNVDVVNDSMAAEESERLKRNPPAVIVFFALTQEELEGEDRIWRFGKPSGQHLLRATVQELVRTYRLAGTYGIRPGGRDIDVYVRDPVP